MIFLTVGSQLPFDRLVRAVDAWVASQAAVSVFGQIADPGPGGYHPEHFQWQRFLEPPEFDRYFEQADLVVAHAGMGSIIAALVAPKPIVVLPRRGHLGEHRNDHQYATAQKFQGRENVFVAMSEEELPSVMDAARSQPAAGDGLARPYADQRLIRAVRGFIHGERVDSE